MNKINLKKIIRESVKEVLRNKRLNEGYDDVYEHFDEVREIAGDDAVIEELKSFLSTSELEEFTRAVEHVIESQPGKFRRK